MGHDSQQPWGWGRKAAPNLLAPTPSGAVEAQPVPGLWVSAWLLSPNSYSITSATGSGFCSPCCLLHSSWQCRAGTCSASQPCLCSPSAAVRVATLAGRALACPSGSAAGNQRVSTSRSGHLAQRDRFLLAFTRCRKCRLYRVGGDQSPNFILD